MTLTQWTAGASSLSWQAADSLLLSCVEQFAALCMQVEAAELEMVCAQLSMAAAVQEQCVQPEAALLLQLALAPRAHVRCLLQMVGLGLGLGCEPCPALILADVHHIQGSLELASVWQKQAAGFGFLLGPDPAAALVSPEVCSPSRAQLSFGPLFAPSSPPFASFPSSPQGAFYQLLL